jgi:hypothetical protein
LDVAITDVVDLGVGKVHLFLAFQSFTHASG